MITERKNHTECIENYIENEGVSYENSNKLSVLIPLFNEENTIKTVIQKIPEYDDLEIIIVDDGSTDSSVKKVKVLKQKDSRISIIKHKKNIGYGQAILTGFKKAKGDIVITLDSDGQHDPRDMSKLIKPILKNEADIVIGSRYLGDCYYMVPFYTQMGEILIKLVLWFLFGLSIGNNQSGFRAFKRETLKYFMDLRNRGMGLTTEILFQSGLKNMRVKEVPINVFPREYGFSYVNLFKIIRSIFSCFIYYFIKKIFKLK